MRDLIHAARSLAKTRAFTVVCVLSLGIGMAPVIGIQYGARALTTPPRGVDPNALVEVVTKPDGPKRPTDKWSYPDFADLRAAAASVELTGWARGKADVTLPNSGKAGTQALFVSANYFHAVGVALFRGPGFPPADNAADPVVIVTHRFWEFRLAADPDVVGKRIPLDGVAHVIAGIAPEGFEGHLPLQGAELFLPLERHPSLAAGNARRDDKSLSWVHILGRLPDGVSVAQASGAVSSTGVALPYHPIGNIEGEDARIVYIVWNVLTAIPLIVVCLNISGMVQVRTAMRERELSIRQAIGASRRRMIRHLLAESVVLAALGTALALLVLFNGLPVLSWVFGEPLPAQVQEALTIDLPMAAMLAGLCLVTSLLFGWLPALRFSRPAILAVILKDDAGGGRVRAGRIHRVTSALEVAIAVPMLVISAMSLERVRATASADLGFAADALYAAPVDLRAADRLRATLATAAGVASTAVADGLPLDFRYRLARVHHAGAVDPRTATAHVTRVGDGYLDTMGIALIGGRQFTSDDRAGAPLVTIVSKALADTLFPAGDAIGQQLAYETGDDQNRKELTLSIVGVTADFPTAQINTDREQMLLPLAQHPDAQTLMLVARALPGEPPAKLRAALENTMRDVNRDFDRTEIVTGASLRESSMSDFLTRSAFAGISGGVALLLAALGIYGVVGLMVTTRTREMAVRVTLGASSARLIGMVLLDVVKLVAPGIVAGALITIAIVRAEGGIVLSPVEPLAYFVGAAVALLTAVLAAFAPARRAASVEPMVAMRST